MISIFYELFLKCMCIILEAWKILSIYIVWESTTRI